MLLVIITSCSSVPKERAPSEQFLQKEASIEFNGVTDISFQDFEKIYFGKFIVAAPNYKEFSNFNTYFQLGVLTAAKKYGISNVIEFENQENFDRSYANNNFLIGPLSNDLVRKIDGLFLKDRALLLNDADENFFISLSEKPQIFALSEHLEKNNTKRIGIISDATNDKFIEREFKRSWFSAENDAVTIEVGDGASERIENFLDVSESKLRYEKIDKASFSKLEFVPRSRKDFKEIIIFPQNPTRLYEIASLVRFNYGLSYEIFSLTSKFDQLIDKNEISLHEIRLVDHTYENKFGYDLSKSRSFSLGFDAMLISYAIANKINGDYKGLLSAYNLSSSELIARPYIN